jgi:CRP-like cAMP-binding protein
VLYKEIDLLKKSYIALPDVIADLHSGIFNDMTQREFLYFWQLGKQGKLSDTYLIRVEEKQNSLFLVLSGEPLVKRNDALVTKLHRGEFVGEISFVTKEPASADVYAESEVNFIEWNQDELRKLKTSNPTFWAKLNDILGKDLAKKIKNNSIIKNL